MRHLENDPRVYVGTYAKYNNGDLTGAWMILSDFDTYDEFLEACYELHADENDPELMFQDIDGEDFGEYDESDCSRLFACAKACENLDNPEAMVAFIRLGLVNDWDNVRREFDERYFGYFDSYTELGYYLAQEGGILSQIPDNLQNYFDFEAYGRDASYDFHEFDGYYFWD